MTDDSAEAPEICHYRVELLNGRWFEINTPMDFVTVWRMARADGCLITSETYAPYHAISCIIRLAQAPAVSGSLKGMH